MGFSYWLTIILIFAQNHKADFFATGSRAWSLDRTARPCWAPLTLEPCFSGPLAGTEMVVIWKWMFWKEAQNCDCRATVNSEVAAKIREDQTAGALVNWFTVLVWITLSISIVYRSETLAWFIVLTRVIHVVYLRRPSMPILRPSFDAWVDLLMLSCLCQKHRQHHYQQSETNRMSL